MLEALSKDGMITRSNWIAGFFAMLVIMRTHVVESQAQATSESDADDKTDTIRTLEITARLNELALSSPWRSR